jgi:DNA polymerase-3 subunit gamma/tau
VSKDASTLKLLEVSEGIKAKYLQQSQAATVSFMLSALNIANQCELNYKLSKNQRLQVELALLKMCHLPSAFNLLTAPLTANRQPVEQVKKKPDPEVLKPKAEITETEELPVLSERPLTYDKPMLPAADRTIKQVEAPLAEKSKSFVPNAHTPSTSVKIPSLKDLGATAAEAMEEEDPYIRGDAMEDFTIDDFLKTWGDYAAKIKKEGNMSLFTVFTSSAPVMLEPYKFEVTVGNKSQESLFRDDKPGVLNFLRTSLRNFSIDVHTRIDEIKSSKKPYTTQEKFQHMANKNPQLAELKRRFNLETDY